MKKITMSVAALAIAVSSYGQCNHGDDWKYEQEVETFKSINYQIADLIDAIRMDMYYGHLDRQRGEYYINEVLKVNNRNKELMASIWRERMVTLGEHQNNIDNNLGNE
jgi:hypothetical protein